MRRPLLDVSRKGDTICFVDTPYGVITKPVVIKGFILSYDWRVYEVVTGRLGNKAIRYLLYEVRTSSNVLIEKTNKWL